MGRNPTSGGTAFRFTIPEVAIMDQALRDSAYATPARSIVEGLAAQFSNSPERVGQRPVASKQVWNWFQNRRHALKAKMEKLKAIAAAAGGETPSAPKAATVAGTSTPKKVDVAMDFEAKSARDGAWYDVSAFIDKRKLDSSEPEVKVRFAGFGSEEDEWVNIANAVRQRSLPCETTECVAVLPGDLILCFQEGSEQALYFDADILDVQRRRHDVRGCRCRFWVRYRHDQTEEVVPLRKVCRRPETEQRLQQAREANAASIRLANSESIRALNGTPSTRTASQIPPTTPATPAQLLISAFNATPNPYTSTSNLYTPLEQGTSTPGLEPIQPISMQLMSTPIPKPPIFQQTIPPPAAPTHSTGVPEGAAVSPSQVPAPSMPIGSQSTTTQQSFPSIESSISRQLNISVPHQQTPPISTGAGPDVFGDAAGAPVVKPNVSGVSEQPTVVSTGLPEPGDLSQPVGKLGIAKPSVVGPTSTADVEAAETSNRAESMVGVNLTLAVNLAGPPSAPLGSSAEVSLPSDSSAANTSIKEKQSLVSKDLPITSVDGSTPVGDAAVSPVSPSASTLPST